MSSRRSTTTHRQGRIHPHQRNADFSLSLLGDDIELGESYVSNVQATEDFKIDVKTKRSHRNRIKQFYTFLETAFPQYYEVGVRCLSAEELQDKKKYYWKNTHDLVYEGFNPKFLKAFLSTRVKKENGKTMSYDNIRKYFDAIQFGAAEVDCLLPVSFYQEKDKFLQAFRKQVAKAKGTGDLEEQEADPIPYGLYVLICTWGVQMGNIMLWVWSILQWNLLARSVNIEPLCFHNFKVFEDNIQAKYDKNKADQGRENTTIKHIYANPTNPVICPFLALGIYLCLNATRYVDSEFLFRRGSDEKDKVASASYCSQLKELILKKIEVVSSFIRIAHANAHGWRKGGATHATSGTTCPPPVPSVARRGEWSMGKVLDVYWHCAEPGDQYLGRVMAGLNSLKSSFKILPPHFNVENPLQNPHIWEAMNLMYGPILSKWAKTPQDPTGTLLRYLASIYFHFEWIQKMANLSMDHPFNAIPLLFKPDLVDALAPLVTTEPSSVIKEASGIPPHVEHCSMLQCLLEMAHETLDILRNQVVNVKQVSLFFSFVDIFIHLNTNSNNFFYFTVTKAVIDALNERDEQNGQVSGAKLEELLQSFQSDILAGVDDRLEKNRDGLGFNSPANQGVGNFDASPEAANLAAPVYGNGKYPAFVYADGNSEAQKFWHVPKSFVFSRVNHYKGWKFWVLGIPNHRENLPDGTERAHPIIPFIYLTQS